MGFDHTKRELHGGSISVDGEFSDGGKKIFALIFYLFAFQKLICVYRVNNSDFKSDKVIKSNELFLFMEIFTSSIVISYRSWVLNDNQNLIIVCKKGKLNEGTERNFI